MGFNSGFKGLIFDQQTFWVYPVTLLQIFFIPVATAPSGSGPPHYLGFTITLRHTTLVRTSLDEWSARRRDLYMTTHNAYKRETLTPPGGIRTYDPSERTAADQRLRPRDHWDRRCSVLLPKICLGIYFMHLLRGKGPYYTPKSYFV